VVVQVDCMLLGKKCFPFLKRKGRKLLKKIGRGSFNGQGPAGVRTGEESRRPLQLQGRRYDYRASEQLLYGDELRPTLDNSSVVVYFNAEREKERERGGGGGGRSGAC